LVQAWKGDQWLLLRLCQEGYRPCSFGKK
jgi:hypothetical protein